MVRPWQHWDLEERCLRVLAGESLHFETPLKGRVFSSAYVPIRDERGKIIFGMVVNHDITDRKRAEEELQKLNETLEQHVIERTALAEARARQLQALAAELIAAEERERRRMAELLHDDLQQILASARMQILSVLETKGSDSTLLNVEHLLVESIAKSRRLSHELSPAILHHSGLVPALNWLAQQMDKQFGLQVQLETQKAQQLDAASLKVFIFRSVQELLFNIVKHAGVKSARIVLFNSNDRLSVSVIDHGRGFDPGILDFSAEKAGFGLLSIKERAQYVGGCLSIESTPGSGSRLILTVPLNLPYESKTVQKIPSWENSCSTAAGSDSISDKLGVVRLVFVDDHAVIREGLITLVAGQPNIEVVGEAADGRQALELARNLHPHVIVMDVSMPVMDGVEATRRIKAEMPHVRVIALSMFEEHEINQRMREAGAEAFISKNASAAELLSAIYRTAPDVALPRQKDS
jgi:signal transduction histidine kinase/ActR/RegA family two-component response regulator